MMDYAYDAKEAWRALEELSEFVLQTRSFAHVDGAWMTAANASAAIAEGVKLTVVNDATIFDSDVTMVDLEPIELNFDPVSVAAVVHVVQAFADVSVQTTASSTPFAVDSGLRFNLEKIALNLNSASGRMHYTVTDISIATKGSSDDWRMKSSVGTVSGVHVDADSAQTENCAMLAEGLYTESSRLRTNRGYDRIGSHRRKSYAKCTRNAIRVCPPYERRQEVLW